MKLKYDIVANPKTLQAELEKINESFRVLYWPEHVVIELFDIEKHVSNTVDPVTEEVLSTTVTYRKREIGVDELGEPVDIWNDYDFDESVIETIINKHDPNRIPVTDTEQLWDAVAYLLQA